MKFDEALKYLMEGNTLEAKDKNGAKLLYRYKKDQLYYKGIKNWKISYNNLSELFTLEWSLYKTYKKVLVFYKQGEKVFVPKSLVNKNLKITFEEI